MTSEGRPDDCVAREIQLELEAQEQGDTERRQEPRRLGAPLAWLNARGLWFQERNNVLGRVYQVAVVARSLLAIHAVGVNLLLVMPRSERPWLPRWPHW